MKNKQFLVAIASVAAITTGTLICSGAAEACPFADKFKSSQSQSAVDSPNTTSASFNSTKAATKLGGIAVLGSVIGGSIFLARRSRKSKAAEISDNASGINSTYQALEFPASLTQDEQPKKDLIRK
jgi:outer membrane murein-binding lipoprotein Lpp